MSRHQPNLSWSYNTVNYKHTVTTPLNSLPVSAIHHGVSIFSLQLATNLAAWVLSAAQLINYFPLLLPQKNAGLKPFCCESTHSLLVKCTINMPGLACPLHFVSCRTNNVKWIYLPSSYWEKHLGYPSLRLDLKAKEQILQHFSPLREALLCKIPFISTFTRSLRAKYREGRLKDNWNCSLEPIILLIKKDQKNRWRDTYDDE